MKKAIIFLALLLPAISSTTLAKDPDLLSIATLSATSATQEQVTAMLGRPERVEETKKTTSWYYNVDNNKVVVRWNKKSDQFVKCSFTCGSPEKAEFDTRLSRKLRSGSTDLTQTLNLLGTPKDMTIKENKQEVHYAYQNNVLRLFFRDRVLVDYTLMGQGRYQ